LTPGICPIDPSRPSPYVRISERKGRHDSADGYRVWREQPTDPAITVAAAASSWLGVPAADVGFWLAELGP
jgi:hypothetical protein